MAAEDDDDADDGRTEKSAPGKFGAVSQITWGNLIGAEVQLWPTCRTAIAAKTVGQFVCLSS